MPHPFEPTLGHAFHNPALLQAALTHPSVTSAQASSSYERMEFLGDAVLGMVVCQALYEKFADLSEGDLTQIKSEVVSRKTCALVGQAMGLTDHMILGKGVNDGSGVPGSIAAAGMEAVICALYLDGGLEVARTFILRHFAAHIDKAAATTHRNNWKALLQQMTQKHLDLSPVYRLVAERGPAHAILFEVRVELGKRHFPSVKATTKKAAEQAAALAAMLELKVAKEADGKIIVRDLDAAGKEVKAGWQTK